MITLFSEQTRIRLILGGHILYEISVCGNYLTIILLDWYLIQIHSPFDSGSNPLGIQTQYPWYLFLTLLTNIIVNSILLFQYGTCRTMQVSIWKQSSLVGWNIFLLMFGMVNTLAGKDDEVITGKLFLLMAILFSGHLCVHS